MNHVLVQMNESYMTQYLEEKKLSQDQEVSGTTRTEEEELLVASKKIQCQVFENVCNARFLKLFVISIIVHINKTFSALPPEDLQS